MLICGIWDNCKLFVLAAREHVRGEVSLFLMARLKLSFGAAQEGKKRGNATAVVCEMLATAHHFRIMMAPW